MASTLGFGDYQGLIRAYISNGLRTHLAEREAERVKDRTVIWPEADSSWGARKGDSGGGGEVIADR